jgi:hypothetical protein
VRRGRGAVRFALCAACVAALASAAIPASATPTATPSETVSTTPAPASAAPTAQAYFTKLPTLTTYTPYVGQAVQLTLLSRTWVPALGTVSFQWLRDGQPISPRGKGKTYWPTAADVGHMLSIRVRISGTGYITGYVTVAATAPVAYPPVAPTTPGAGSTGAAAATRAAAHVKVSWVKRVVTRHHAAKLKVTVTAKGVAGIGGKIAVKVHGKTHQVSYVKVVKAKHRVTVPKMAKRGRYAVTVTYKGTGTVAPKTVKLKSKLVVR